ncbi:hypothetical protein JCM17823_00250 [Halorubrum gandharaense]
MPTRRRLLAVAGTSSLAGLAGCSALVTGEPVEVASEPARGSERTAEDTGYDLKDLSEESVEEEFSVFGRPVEVQASNWVATHGKTIVHSVIGPADLGVFAVLTTPSVKVAGQEFNPVGGYDNDDLVDLMDDEYEDIDVEDEAVDTLDRTVLGESVEVSVYEGDATFDDRSLDVYVHTGVVRHEDDYVVTMAIYPQELEDEERENIRRMGESVEHPVTPDET